MSGRRSLHMVSYKSVLEQKRATHLLIVPKDANKEEVEVFHRITEEMLLERKVDEVESRISESGSEMRLCEMKF